MAVWVWTLAFVSGSLTWAQQRLDLASLVEQALERNPEILAAQKRYEAARQRPAQAGSLPDPVFSPSFNSNGRPWPGALLGLEPTSNIGFMVSQEIPFPGKRRLAGQIAALEAAAEFEQYQQTRASVISRVKQAYYRLAFVYPAQGILERNLSLLSEFIETAQNRYTAGKSDQAEIFKAYAQQSLVETRRLLLARERRSREAELNSLLNRRPGSPLPQPEELRQVTVPVGLEELLAAAQENSPLLRREQRLVQRSEQGVNLARKEFLPDVTLNAGYYHMGRMPDMFMFRADLKAPLYWFRKQRAGLVEQSQQLAQARRDFEAAHQSLFFRIQDDYALAEASARLVEIYRQSVIPQAGLVLESSLISYQAGKTDLLAVLNNQMALLEHEMSYWEQLLNLHLALVRLEEASGRRLL
ncbi:MAG: TolC family protein [Bryobacteraceae bacterium]|nr:TolC family protein [Bryobacteraceae bacterium]MDW8376592.1 TolC family protein [Bryobacterales bacterium]